jgi:hypothetical protein
VREIRTLRLTWRGLETWPWWNCEPIPQSKEQAWKPSTYSRRACPRPYRCGGMGKRTERQRALSLPDWGGRKHINEDMFPVLKDLVFPQYCGE